MMSANDSDDDAEAAPATSGGVPPGRGWRRHPLLTGLVVGVAGALAATVVLLGMAAMNRPPRLSPAAYEQAVERWEQHGPASYDLDLELGGRRPGTVHVEVRQRQVTHMTRDGVQPAQKRTWDVWSVPGQLDTIGQELDMAQDPARSFGDPRAAEVVMWAEFDPRYGYPRRYDRVVLGADLEVHWRITRFAVVQDENQPP